MRVVGPDGDSRVAFSALDSRENCAGKLAELVGQPEHGDAEIRIHRPKHPHIVEPQVAGVVVGRAFTVEDLASVELTPDEAAWLDPGLTDPEQVMALLAPYPADQMTAYPVSALVNSWENEGPELIAAVTPTEQLSF